MMFKRMLVVGALAGTLGLAAGAGSASAGTPDCNWGELTAANAGPTQGTHASDPSGDGHGPGTADEPRAGLANVSFALFGGDRGDMQATCVFIESELP